ncbi:MAG: NifU family protein [Gemmatimonadaceae bacterium]
MAEGKNLRAVADRIEALVQEMGALPDPRARERSEELVTLLMQFYGAGLRRVLEIVDEDDDAAARLFDRFVDDELVESLLVLHGLHPVDVQTRIQRALDKVRPYLGSHGGDVKLLGVTDGVVSLRLEGSCHGCDSSSLTMKLAVERAIEEAAPEVTRIDVDGVPEAPAPAHATGLLQISPPARRRAPAADQGAGEIALPAAQF